MKSNQTLIVSLSGWIDGQLAVIVFILLCSISLSAQNIIKVNNTNDLQLTDYADLQAAVDAAQPGDILMVYPSATNYGNVTIDKPLTIYGAGYNIDQNPSLGIETAFGSSNISNVTIAPGVDEVLISGLLFGQLIADGVSNLSLVGNYITSRVEVNASNNCRFFGNYFSRQNFVSGYHLEIGSSSNILISNNLFYAYYSFTRQCHSGGTDNLEVSSSSGVVVRNNVFRDRCNISNTLVENNIFLSNGATECSAGNSPIWGSGNAIRHNVFTYTGNYGDDSNVVGIDAGAIFAGYPTQGDYSFDSRYQLLPDSPAKGVGTGGTDCGAFGGGAPYKLSGIPALPLVYQLIVPENPAGSSMNIQVKVRSEN